MFTNLDWTFVQKKLLENKKLSLGAAGTVAAVTLLYFLTRSNDIDDEIDTLPDYAKQDIDYEFTHRFNNPNKNRKRTISDHYRRQLAKPSQNSMNNPNEKDQELKVDELDTGHKHVKHSLLDPNNPNYSYDMTNEEDYDENNDSENEEAFSVDPYYVPFRVNNAKTKRKPDAPFMAMFKMYANKQPSEQLINDENDIHENDMDINERESEDEKKEEEKEDDNNNENNENNIDESPPLNPHIPSHSIVALNGMNGMNHNVNPLDSLRERYYKKELPKSLQPNALSTAFSSDNQKAIQNDLNADQSLLSGIKQSVQMITQSND